MSIGSGEPTNAKTIIASFGAMLQLLYVNGLTKCVVKLL
jgi:hypothetical protein